MDVFPMTGKRTRGLSSGSATPWRRVAVRLGNERRRAASSAATAAATTATTATAAKGRPSDDDDIADLLLSFSRAPTKQVRDASGAEREIEIAGTRSVGVTRARHRDRKNAFGEFFFLSLLSLDGRSVFRSKKGNTLFEDGGGFFFRCERRAREGAFVALPAQATSRSRLESGAFDVLEAAQVPDRRCESLRRSPRGDDY
jgi:hypothetical protein